MTPMLRVRSGAALFLAILATATACRDERLAGPQVASPSLAAAQQGRPFYYYQGEPVYLDIDSAGFVVASDLADPTTVIAEALSGLPAPQLRRVSPRHWVVRIPGGANQGARAAALARLRADGRLSFASVLHRLPSDGSPVTLLGSLAVQFRAGTPRGSIDSLVSSLGLRILREPMPDSGWYEYVLEYPRDRDPLDVAAIVDRLAHVAWADPNKISGARLDTSDPYFASQYYLQNAVFLNGVRVDDNVVPAWSVTLGTNNIKVFVVDDGIDIQHADLFCSTYFLWAYDAFLNQFPDTPTYPHANDRHGTAVAGIINGCHNTSGTAGIAPGVSLGVIRIFRNGLVAGDQAVADAINWAWAIGGADVLSNSWGGGAQSNQITNAINNAATQGRGGKGTVVVFAGGNTSARQLSIIGALNWQATLANVIAVGAINSNGQLTDYTPEGAALDIVAPSSHFTGAACGSGDVFTTDRVGPLGCNDGPNNDPLYTSSFGGTSAAAPQVAAAAGLLLTMNPNLTRQQVTSLLLTHADRGGSWATTTQFGHGKLNVYNAMVPLLPPPPFSVSISGPTVITQKRTYTWTANASGGSGGYSYQWSVYYQSSGQTIQLGTGQTQSRLVQPGDGIFEMRVTVTSGSSSANAVLQVQECIGVPGGCYQ